jgi:UDP-glucose 4-epimerase
LVVLDNLSRGFQDSVLRGTLLVGDVGDAATVSRILRDFDVETVMHFAAFIIMPESVADPLKYYLNNTANTRTLFECCAKANVKHFIFLLHGSRLRHAGRRHGQ